MALTQSQLRQVWAPRCKGPFARVTLFGGAVVTVRPTLVPAVLELDAVLRRWDYRARRGVTGAYNCRRIGGSGEWSLHAFAAAIDINWDRNPFGRRLVTDMPRGMVDEILAIETRRGVAVWSWGGHWRNNKDAMHYEPSCSPADIARGFAYSTPAIEPEPEPQPEVQAHCEEEPMFLAINRVGFYAVVNGVPIDIGSMEAFGKASGASTGVPVLWLDEAPGRRMLNELLAKHAFLTGRQS